MEAIEKAIEKGELKEFLMGRGNYFVKDRDWGGHSDSHTNMLIERYLKSSEVYIDKKEMFELIDNVYVSILEQNDLNIQEFVIIIVFIYLYFFWKNDNKLEIEWDISDSLKQQILRLKPFFEQQNSIFTSDISGNLQLLKNKYGFTLE